MLRALRPGCLRAPERRRKGASPCRHLVPGWRSSAQSKSAGLATLWPEDDLGRPTFAVLTTSQIDQIFRSGALIWKLYKALSLPCRAWLSEPSGRCPPWPERKNRDPPASPLTPAPSPPSSIPPVLLSCSIAAAPSLSPAPSVFALCAVHTAVDAVRIQRIEPSRGSHST